MSTNDIIDEGRGDKNGLAVSKAVAWDFSVGT
jgi:hypothetical protein